MPHLSADNLRLHYELAGSPDAEPLALLHGILGSIEAELASHQAHLSLSYRVLAIDFRMHDGSVFGESHLTLDGFNRDLMLLLDHAGISSARFFGYSLGGLVALNLESMLPGRVVSLIMHGTKFFWDTDSAASFVVQVSTDDRDDLVPPKEAMDLARLLPRSTLSILPGTRHPMRLCDQVLLAWNVAHLIRRSRGRC